MAIPRKCETKTFQAILDGEKTFKANFQPTKMEKGDIIELLEVDSKGDYTGK
jgi:hypothetical protein